MAETALCVERMLSVVSQYREPYFRSIFRHFHVHPSLSLTSMLPDVRCQQRSFHLFDVFDLAGSDAIDLTRS